jgi:hypothetical protein
VDFHHFGNLYYTYVIALPISCTPSILLYLRHWPYPRCSPPQRPVGPHRRPPRPILALSWIRRLRRLSKWSPSPMDLGGQSAPTGQNPPPPLQVTTPILLQQVDVIVLLKDGISRGSVSSKGRERHGKGAQHARCQATPPTAAAGLTPLLASDGTGASERSSFLGLGHCRRRMLH